jgi:hypothetical protein
MRVLIWATHLQTDILALAAWLDRSEDVALMIVTPGAGRFLETPIAGAMPFKAPLLDRAAPATMARVRAFAADVVVADNHIPPPGTAPRLFYMWHGLGWKARSRLDLQVFYHQVRLLTGIDPRTPNPRFRAQCYGPSDRAWRIGNWRLPAEACVEIGMAFSDLLLAPPYERARAAAAYRLDMVHRPTVLMAVTWHYGGVFAARPSLWRSLRSLSGRTPVNRQDSAFIDRVIAAVRARDANLLICLHDRHRYDPAFLAMFEDLAATHPFVELRFKNEHPDNLSDLLVADVMISNLSSFLSYFYLLRRPAIHILPGREGSPGLERARMLFSRIRLRHGCRDEEAWMLDPRDTGGPVVHDPEGAVRAIAAALDDPSSGRAATGRWLARHLPRIDGGACRRFEAELRLLCQAPSARRRPGTARPGVQLDPVCPPAIEAGA